MDELRSLAYFSSLNHISRKIAQPETLLVKYLGNKWSDYSPEEQEELFDDLCVPHSDRFDESTVADDSRLPSCWPTLKLPSGEKIIVDENDIWTWRDEHSGPFSWKSKSQQDLTLLDLQPDNLTKPHGKAHKSSESEEPASPKLPASQRPHFLPNPESWTQAVLEDFVTNCQEEIESPSHAPTAPASAAESPVEEVNPAFEGSVEDLSPSATPAHAIASQSQEKLSEVVTPDQEASSIAQTENANMTPPPKKLSHLGIGKKDGKGSGGKLAIDSSQQLLIIHNREDEGTAFTNPAMEVEWSNFVGQSSTDPDDDRDSLSTPVNKPAPVIAHPPASGRGISSPVVREPPVMVMDRGSLRGGEESTESTPDHTTQLLKPGRGGEEVVAGEKEAEKEEVVYVVDEGSGAFSVSSKLVAAAEDDSHVPRSGFDFLDNW